MSAQPTEKKVEELLHELLVALATPRERGLMADYRLPEQFTAHTFKQLDWPKVGAGVVVRFPDGSEFEVAIAKVA